ncbi:MAG: transglycosylase SLT domain-containing protein [Methylovirgula sp.]|nr:transglycosylase SLT domain-containing protein [Methylovirgula sp.]
MANEVAQVGIGITADNRTEIGAKAAERRLAQVAKRTSSAMASAGNDNDRMARKMSSSMIGSFSKIEQAASRVFGTRSMTSGLSGKMSAIKQAASAMGDGMAGAATEGEGFAAVIGTVGVAAAATGGILLAGAYAGYKMADGWAKSAAQIGRTAEIIGVSTKTLQEFTAAAERVGVDKSTAQGAMGTLSQTLNDARFGRNPAAMAALSRLGVGIKLNKDGTVNVDAMLPGIASAIGRQNSSGRRTAASLLGIPLNALPAFSQGGGALSVDMKDALKTAPMVSDSDIKKGQRFVRKEAQLGQLKDKAENAMGAGAAGLAEPVLDKLLKGALWVNDGGSLISKAGKAFGEATTGIGKAADRMGQAAGYILSGGGMNEAPYAGDTSLYGRIEHAEGSRQNQISPKGAIGVMQLEPDTARRVAAGMGIPFDEGKFRNDERYNRMLGHAYLDTLTRKYGGDDTLIAAAYNAGEGNADKWIRTYGDPRKRQISDADFANRIPFKETRDYVHKVVVEFKNAPKGTSAMVHNPGGAVSYSIIH